MSKKPPSNEHDPSSDSGTAESDTHTAVASTEVLRERFRSRFQVLPALTEELKDQVYRSRHSVYCEDLKWEPVSPSGREIDEFDSHAIQILLRHVVTGENIACARLILTAGKSSDFRLPFETFCKGTLDPAVFDIEAQPRDKVGEVSRLAVIAKYRRRLGEARRSAPASEQDFGTAGQPRFPYILIGLYLGIVAVAELNGIETMLMLTEQRLADHFHKLGVDIRQIGAPVEHRGMRVPSVMSVSGIVRGLNRFVRPMYDAIVDEALAVYRQQQ